MIAGDMNKRRAEIAVTLARSGSTDCVMRG
jgi:hypothetical protein